AVVPGVLTMFALVFFVKEGAVTAGRHEKTARAALGWPDRRALRCLVPLGIFTLGNSSDTFLLLKAGDIGASLETLPLLWMGLHVTKTVVSLAGGRVSDKIGARRTIAIGWIVYAAIYGAFS